ncbi:MAG: hypothetical protein QW160_03840 [Candidatus Bathyarchaeia archaeon]
MPELTEYGEVMLNDYVDEWGRRRINGLLEDGTKIIVTVEIILKQWSQTGFTSHVYTRPYCTMKLAQNLSMLHTFVCHRFTRLTQSLQTFHKWTVEYPFLILRRWVAALQTTYAFSRSSRLVFLFERLGLLHEFYAVKPTAKRTRLFLVIGDLAIQLSND